MHKSHNFILKAGYTHDGSRFLGDQGEEDRYSKGDNTLTVNRSSGKYYLHNSSKSHPIDRGDSHEELMRSPYFDKDTKESMNLIDRAKKLLQLESDEMHDTLLKYGYKKSTLSHPDGDRYNHERSGHYAIKTPHGALYHYDKKGGSEEVIDDADSLDDHLRGIHGTQSALDIHQRRESVDKMSDDDLMDRHDKLTRNDRNPDNRDADKDELKRVKKELNKRGFTRSAELDESFNKILGVVGKSKEGVAYMIHNTIQGINSGVHPDKAFKAAAENENFYGQRPDVVKDRKLAIATLSRFGHKVNDFTESLDLSEGHNHEDIANNPPKFVPSHHHEIWKGLVLRSKHTNYGAAVNHYKRHMFKHGSYAATKLAKISAGQSMTAESFGLNPEVSSSTDKLTHTDKKTTAGLIGAKIRRYKKFGATHSAFANGAKSHNVSSRLSSS